MKLADVVVGERYTAKISGRLCTVRVTELKEVPPASWSTGRTKWRTLIYAVNEATGRKITIRSPQRLRANVEGCEFCSHASNRPDGSFTCPYCDKGWGPATGTTLEQQAEG